MTCSFKRLLLFAVQFNFLTSVTLKSKLRYVAPEISLLCHPFIYPHESQNSSPSARNHNQSKESQTSLTLDFITTKFLSNTGIAFMAFRSMSTLRSIMGRLRGSSATYATSTTQKMKAYAPTADYIRFLDHQHGETRGMKGDFVPVYVAIGMIVLSMSLGLHTAKQQLKYSPGVRVSKKTRETLPEVEYPEKVVDEADKFVKKSLFRKVAHVQEFDYGNHHIPDPIRKDVFAHKPRVETLKSVGVDPKLQ